jgi:type VI secretion system secreted protein Hcp
MSNAMFLKVEGVDGESTDADHDKWIQVLSYSHGVSQSATGISGTGGQTGGVADFQDLSIVKVLDTSTPDLNIKCAKGEHIPKIELEICLATGDKHTFMKYTIEDCVVTSVSPGGDSEGEVRPLETVTFAYDKLKWEYTPIDNTGAPGSTTDRTWNLATNAQE